LCIVCRGDTPFLLVRHYQHTSLAPHDNGHVQPP
jgi:hypothetical protein